MGRIQEAAITSKGHSISKGEWDYVTQEDVGIYRFTCKDSKIFKICWKHQIILTPVTLILFTVHGNLIAVLSVLHLF